MGRGKKLAKEDGTDRGARRGWLRGKSSAGCDERL